MKSVGQAWRGKNGQDHYFLNWVWTCCIWWGDHDCIYEFSTSRNHMAGIFPIY